MLTILLFIGVIAFYLLWQREKQKNTTRSLYQTGWHDGRRALIDKLRGWLSSDDTVNRQALLRILEDSRNQPAGQTEMVVPPHAAASPEATSPMAPIPVPVPPPSREDQEARNQNIMLFTASLLFVAAAAAFVTTTMSDMTKLIGIWMAVAAFYGVGMALHSTTKLRPAAIAFIGTSLGALPLAGIALHELMDLSAEISWLLTSVIGVIAYFYAAIRLQSQVVSYLTLAFVVSLSASLSESLSASVMWTFVAIIVLSLGFNLLALLRPGWLPAIFAKPIDDTANYLTPVTLGASILMANHLDLYHYGVIVAVAALQYVVLWVQTRLYDYEFAVRLLAQIFFIVMAWDMTGGGFRFGWVLLVTAALQQAYTLAYYKSYRHDREIATETFWYYTMQLVQLGAIIAWAGHDMASTLASLALAVIGLSSLALSLRSRNVLAGISGLLASVPLVLLVGREVLSPALDWSLIAAGLLVLASGIALLWKDYIEPRSSVFQKFMLSGFGLYSGLAVLISLVTESAWNVALLALAGGLTWWLSYLSRRQFISLFGSIIIGLSFIYLWVNQDYDPDWLTLAAGGFMMAWLYPLYFWLLGRGDSQRAEYGLYVIWGSLAIGILSSFANDKTELVAALAVVMLAATIFYEGYRRQDIAAQEISAYIGTFGLMLIVGIMIPELNIVFYAHWAAAVIALVAWWRQQHRRQRLTVALALITASSGIFALSEGGMYTLLFLVEHVMLLIAGTLLRKNWATLWGLIAVCAAVLYFLRDVAYLSFGFLGLVVIAVVLWQLSRKK